MSAQIIDDVSESFWTEKLAPTGTPTQVFADKTYYPKVHRGVHIFASGTNSTNNITISVGDEITPTNNKAFQLEAGKDIFIKVEDPAKIWIGASGGSPIGWAIAF